MACLTTLFLGSVHDKIYLGSNVKIPCFGKKEPPKLVKNYVWERSKNITSKNNRHHISKDGVLTIYDVNVEDMGTYFCICNTFSGKKKIKHTIEVVQLPSTRLRITFVYSVKHCNRESEEITERFIETKLTETACLNEDCQIDSIRSDCQLEALPIPSLRVTVSVILPSIPNGNCDVDCTRVHLKVFSDKKFTKHDN
ncbi:uncharacterized protein CEXT_322411 [Caerostris extrusa]|uniref:Ig-like domain-containing protein n=1 Tax=Caerostris extrusa TaxID=172846 RepID=A0AAV4MSG7_CAEEX|nr:uncharacterized protein CEXT_322411 [Caerostris extrusa]